jgi:hypothetical protein
LSSRKVLPLPIVLLAVSAGKSDNRAIGAIDLTLSVLVGGFGALGVLGSRSTGAIMNMLFPWMTAVSVSTFCTNLICTSESNL